MCIRWRNIWVLFWSCLHRSRGYRSMLRNGVQHIHPQSPISCRELNFSCNRQCSPRSDHLHPPPPQDRPHRRKQVRAGEQASAPLAQQVIFPPSCLHQPLYHPYRRSRAGHSCSTPSFKATRRREKGAGLITRYTRSVRFLRAPQGTGDEIGSCQATLKSPEALKVLVAK